jgi:enoyl-CoA hydratase/carnithine racemase
VPDTTNGIRVERTGRIGTVWLDRPDRGNAFTTVMQDELHMQLDLLDHN